MTRPPPTSTLFPYTTLFRSVAIPGGAGTCQPEDQCTPPPCTGEGCACTGGVQGNCDAGLVCCQDGQRSEEHTSELQSQSKLVCRLLLEKKKRTINELTYTYN